MLASFPQLKQNTQDKQQLGGQVSFDFWPHVHDYIGPVA